MDTTDYLDAVRRESSVFYDRAQAAPDRNAPVPSCPEWTVDDLIWHLAEVHWFWATVVEQRLTDGVDDLDTPARPASEGLVPFGREQVEHLLGALQDVDPATPVWTWAARKDVGFVQRHQVQEAAVHRWDMEYATGEERAPIAAAIAADSIDEFLEVSLPFALRDVSLPGSVHIHSTDAPGEWIVHADGTEAASREKGNVVLSGSASRLLLALYQRVPLRSLEVVGDPSVAEAFLSHLAQP
jgi:uncharacterized protein (TIGR03083 family)